MLKYFRYYAWMTDIVPAILAIFNVTMPVKFRHEIISELKPWLGLSASQIWGLSYTALIIISVAHMAGETKLSYDWVNGEQKKTFNLATLCVLIGTIFILPIAYQPAFFKGMPGIYLLIAVPILIMLYIIMEFLRPYYPKPPVAEEVITPDTLSVKAGDSFYYRENLTSSYAIKAANVFILLYAVLLIRCWPYHAVALAIVTAFLMVCRVTTLTINQENIALKSLGSSHKIKLNDIDNCGIYYCTPQEREAIRPIKVNPDRLYFVSSGMEGRCLEIKTKAGKTVIIGMKKPLTACKLIQSALAAHRDIA